MSYAAVSEQVFVGENVKEIALAVVNDSLKSQVIDEILSGMFEKFLLGAALSTTHFQSYCFFASLECDCKFREEIRGLCINEELAESAQLQILKRARGFYVEEFLCTSKEELSCRLNEKLAELGIDTDHLEPQVSSEAANMWRYMRKTYWGYTISVF